VDPSSAKAKAAKPLGEYAKQYLDSLAGQVDSSTVDGYAAIYRAHIGPVFGSTPVASITTADVARFRAQLLAPHAERSFVTRGQPRPKPKGSKPANRRTVTRSPKTVKQSWERSSGCWTPPWTTGRLIPTRSYPDAGTQRSAERVTSQLSSTARCPPVRSGAA
jgi:hypothetical protein